MEKILICWVGLTDINASMLEDEAGLGPIAHAITSRIYDKLALISNFQKEKNEIYLHWLKSKTPIDIKLYSVHLSGPTIFSEIYESAVKIILEIQKSSTANYTMTYHLSPGTPQMAAVWIILSKTRFPAELIESSKQHGVKTTSIPFDISADFIPDLFRGPDRNLEKLAAGLPKEAPEFDDIIHRSKEMQQAILKARRVAPRSIPILIEGESGTGKELFAHAIHDASPRRKNPFKVINCGAIPKDLIESELFGHEKGAFTGAIKSKIGYFEAAHQGTLFLDEIGELPIDMQVKLLRTVQEGEVMRIGTTQSRKINIRIIAATNRNLLEEVAIGSFREDLFYRLAVAVINLPPLRERIGDINLLIDHFLKKINQESINELGYTHKTISSSARNIIHQHSWPGNIRELQNTLTRAAIWSPNTKIGAEDIEDALFPNPNNSKQISDILNHSIDKGIDLPRIIKEVAVHYLERGLKKENGNKTKTAKLLGLSSYQTLTNWLKKYEIEQ